MLSRDTPIAEVAQMRWLAIFVLLVSGCTFNSKDIETKVECQEDADCLDGRVCSDGECQALDDDEGSLEAADVAPPDAG